jgi:hypothetical protein
MRKRHVFGMTVQETVLQMSAAHKAEYIEISHMHHR